MFKGCELRGKSNAQIHFKGEGGERMQHHQGELNSRFLEDLSDFVAI